MKSYYIASGLENVNQVRWLKSVLDAAGWRHTHDWTVGESVVGQDWNKREEIPPRAKELLTTTAKAESEGVWMADVVIALLPGGRGTHVELGMAIGLADALVGASGAQDPRIVIYSPTPEKDFGTTGTTCAFYHHPCVELFTDIHEMVNSLLGAN